MLSVAMLVFAGTPAQGEHTWDEIFEILMPTSCPGGMNLVGRQGHAHETSLESETSFCVDHDRQGHMHYRDCLWHCWNQGKHICTARQWQNACYHGNSSGLGDGNWEWTGTEDHAHGSGFLQMTMGGGGCHQISWSWSGQHNNYSNEHCRCCKGGGLRAMWGGTSVQVE